jgi:hypothetical protein
MTPSGHCTPELAVQPWACYSILARLPMPLSVGSIAVGHAAAVTREVAGLGPAAGRWAVMSGRAHGQLSADWVLGIIHGGPYGIDAADLGQSPVNSYMGDVWAGGESG